jgi:hypothetical protein
MDTILVAAMLILLHRADGGEVAVYPSHVTALHAKAPTSAENKVATPAGRCAVWLTDGRMLSVIETCDVVKRLLEAAPNAAQ